MHVHVWRPGVIFLVLPAAWRDGLVRDAAGTFKYKFCSQCRKVLL